MATANLIMFSSNEHTQSQALRFNAALQQDLPTLEKASVCEIPDQATGNLLIIAVVIITRQLDTPVKGDIATFAQTNARLQ